MMVERTTIKVDKQLADQIKEIQGLMGDKSINKTINRFIPQGISTKENYIQEPPAFTISNKIVSWNELKKSKIADQWDADNETATVIFKDDFGALVRFMFHNDVWVEYYHFI